MLRAEADYEVWFKVTCNTPFVWDILASIYNLKYGKELFSLFIVMNLKVLNC